MGTVVILLFAAMLAASPALAQAPPSVDDAAKKAVLAKLKDPDSAQFRNIRAADGWVCGEVNAKNSYGGYTGYSGFVGSLVNGKDGPFVVILAIDSQNSTEHFVYTEGSRKHCPP